VTLLAALFFVLALNLSGVFQWGAFAQSMTSNVSARGRYADAFLSGVLASVVATPCTAPFMGAAVGFTVSQGAGLALAIFLMLGFGMALPVLLLAFFPGLLKRLPKPGAWMETFKQVLAFPLYATVAWLAWVLGAQAGNDAGAGAPRRPRADRDGRVGVRALGAFGQPLAARGRGVVRDRRRGARLARSCRPPRRAQCPSHAPVSCRGRAGLPRR
jgi:thiol:disulfide interchange protein